MRIGEARGRRVYRLRRAWINEWVITGNGIAATAFAGAQASLCTVPPSRKLYYIPTFVSPKMQILRSRVRKSSLARLVPYTAASPLVHVAAINTRITRYWFKRAPDKPQGRRGNAIDLSHVLDDQRVKEREEERVRREGSGEEMCRSDKETDATRRSSTFSAWHFPRGMKPARAGASISASRRLVMDFDKR